MKKTGQAQIKIFLVAPAGFEPAECQIQSLMPYHLAMGQYVKLPRKEAFFLYGDLYGI